MSGPSVLTAQPPPMLMQTQQAPHHHMLGPPQLGPDVNPLVTTVQPEVQLVTQSTLVPVSHWGPPHSNVQIFSTTSAPPVMSLSSVITSSPAVSSTYTYHHSSREEHKRRFTEEKLEEKVPENLLGYEHGPPHLANLVVQGPPPQDVQNTGSKHPVYQPHVSEMYSGAQMVSSSPQPVYTTTIISAPADDRNSPYARYTPDPPGDNTDKQLMPPPPLPASLKRSSYEKPGGSDRKKSKEYGEEDEEDKHRGRGKYQYNQYSNAPQLYPQADSEQYPDQRPDSETGYQYQPQHQPITEHQYQYTSSHQPATITHMLPPPSHGPPSIMSTLPSHLYSQQPMYSISPSQSPPNPYTQEVLTSSGQYATMPHTITIAGPPPPPTPDHMLHHQPDSRLQPEEMPPPQMEQMQAPQGYSNMPPPISSGQYMVTQSMPLMAPPTQPPVSYTQVHTPMSSHQPHSYPPPPPPGMPYYLTS